MPETEEEKRIWDAAMERAQDPEWNRRWFDEQLPVHLAAAKAAYAALSDEQLQKRCVGQR